MTNSIMQPWTSGIGLRHQGVLVSAIRGCDDAEKDSPTKLLARHLRAVVLRAHCGDAAKARTFIEPATPEQFSVRSALAMRALDPLPHHYVMHLIHAAEIIGYLHPDEDERARWSSLYLAACRKLHLNPETREQMDARLSADEDTFARQQSHDLAGVAS